jgi:hypothetical protein
MTVAATPRRDPGTDERGALHFLDSKLYGHLESFMLAHGFAKETLDALVAKGLTTSKHEVVYDTAVSRWVIRPNRSVLKFEPVSVGATNSRREKVWRGQRPARHF